MAGGHAMRTWHRLFADPHAAKAPDPPGHEDSTQIPSHAYPLMGRSDREGKSSCLQIIFYNRIEDATCGYVGRIAGLDGVFRKAG
jgi:hypothetical protein